MAEDGYYGVLERGDNFVIVKCHACRGMGYTNRYGGDGEGTTRACVGCKGAGVHVLSTATPANDDGPARANMGAIAVPGDSRTDGVQGDKQSR